MAYYVIRELRAVRGDDKEVRVLAEFERRLALLSVIGVCLSLGSVSDF